MLDQVLRVAEIVHEGTSGDFYLTSAALMHKAFEAKRVRSGMAATYDTIEELIGSAGAAAVLELQSYNDHTDNSGQALKVKEAAGLGKDAKIILMAEKIANFETSIHHPNPAKPHEWHMNYFQTRIDIGRAAADAHKGIAKTLEETYQQGISSLQKKMPPARPQNRNITP